MGWKEWVKEKRDVIVEIISRPKEVLTPGYDPTPGIGGGTLYGDPTDIPVSLGGTAPPSSYGYGGDDGSGVTPPTPIIEDLSGAEEVLPPPISAPPTPPITKIGKIQPGDPREVEYEQALTRAAREKGEDLSLAEREKIMGEIYGFEVRKTGYDPSGIAKREVFVPSTPQQEIEKIGAGAEEMAKAVGMTTRGELTPQDLGYPKIKEKIIMPKSIGGKIYLGLEYFGGKIGETTGVLFGEKAQTFIEKPVPLISKEQFTSFLDIYAKATIFSPYMVTGAAAKKAKAKTKEQELVYVRKFTTEETEQARALIGKYEKIYAIKGRRALEKVLVKTFKGLKTEQARKGYAELLKELVRKEMIIPPSYRISVPAPVKTMFPEPPKIELIFDITKFSSPQMSYQQIASSFGGVSIFDTKGKIKQKVITIPSTKVSQIEKQKEKQMLKTPQLIKSLQVQTQIQAPRLKQLQLQIPKQIQAQPTIQVPKMDFPKLTKPGIKLKPQLKLPKKIIPIPFIPKLAFKEPRGAKEFARRTKQYATSYTAIIKGVRGARPKPLTIRGEKVYTGFEVRPLGKRGEYVFETKIGKVKPIKKKKKKKKK